MSEKKSFRLGAVLSITTGRLLSDMDDIYSILEWMTREEGIYTHQLPRLSDECKPYLLLEFPQLKDVTGDGINPDNWAAKLEELERQYGGWLPVPRIPVDDHDHIHPYDEALEIMEGSERVIVVEIADDEGEARDA